MEKTGARRKTGKRHKNVEAVISAIKPDDMADFLRLEMSSDPDMADRFVDYFALKGASKKAATAGGDESARVSIGMRDEKTYKRHYDNVTALYDEIIKKYGSLGSKKRAKFDRFEKDARARIKADDRTGAAAVYRAVAEATADIIPKTDYDDRFYHNVFAKFLHKMASCYDAKKVGFGLRKEGISMIFRMLCKKSANVETDPYIDELLKFCGSNKQELRYLRDLAANYLPSEVPPEEDKTSHHTAIGVAVLLADVLTSLEDPSIEDVLKPYHKEHNYVCAMYVQAVAKRDRSGAQRLLDDAASAHSSTELISVALKVYDEKSPEHLKMLEAIYSRDPSPEYYKKLRAAHPNWEEGREAVLSNLNMRSIDNHPLIRALLIEGMWEEAVRKMGYGPYGIIDMLEFHDELQSAAGPANAHAICRNMIKERLVQTTAKVEYRRICMIIKKMMAVPGYENEAKRFAADLKFKYRYRDDLLAEIQKIS